MGSRVDIFVIENGKCKIGYSHGGAPSLWKWVHVLIDLSEREGYEVGKYPNPMADCYAEAAVIVDLDNKEIQWCSDHSETIDGWLCKAETVEGWSIKEVSCYCTIFFELKRRKLWSFEKSYNIDGCRFNRYDDND